MGENYSVEVKFFRLSEALQPYFTSLYAFNIVVDDECLLEDCLHPEWTAMRFTRGTPPRGVISEGMVSPRWPFVVSGPTSKALHFGLETAEIWGLGVQPAGWAKFVDGEARNFVNRIVNGSTEPAFAMFTPMLDIVRRPDATWNQIALRINSYLMQHVGRASPHEEQVLACHEASRDPDIATVADLCDRLALGTRSLERLCARFFGFSPKQLLRRQRFLRSLATYMLDPHGNWSDALDPQYYDQSQFVRDFRSFMCMTPSEYAERPRPVIDQIIAQRMADQGALPEPPDPPPATREWTEEAGRI